MKRHRPPVARRRPRRLLASLEVLEARRVLSGSNFDAGPAVNDLIATGIFSYSQSPPWAEVEYMNGSGLYGYRPAMYGETGSNSGSSVSGGLTYTWSASTTVSMTSSGSPGGSSGGPSAWDETYAYHGSTSLTISGTQDGWQVDSHTVSALDINWHAWGTDSDGSFTLDRAYASEGSWDRTQGSDREGNGSSGEYDFHVEGSGSLYGPVSIGALTLVGRVENHESMHRSASDGGDSPAGESAVVDSFHSREFSVDRAEGASPHSQSVTKGHDEVSVSIWGDGPSGGYVTASYTDDFRLRYGSVSGSPSDMELEATGKDGFTYYVWEGGASPDTGASSSGGSVAMAYRARSYRVAAKVEQGPGGPTESYSIEGVGAEADSFRITGIGLEDNGSGGFIVGDSILLVGDSQGSSSFSMSSGTGVPSQGRLDFDGSESMAVLGAGQGGSSIQATTPPPVGPPAGPIGPPVPPPPAKFPWTDHPPIGPGVVPNAQQLLFNSAVQTQIQLAWARAQVNKPGMVHEEGGIIYMNPTTGQVRVVPFTGDPMPEKPTRGTEVNTIFVPENIPGFYIVGTFHTHPWNAGPSDVDMGTTEQLGVPAFIVSKTGYRFYGYSKRRGGFTGNPATWPPP